MDSTHLLHLVIAVFSGTVLSYAITTFSIFKPKVASLLMKIQEAELLLKIESAKTATLSNDIKSLNNELSSEREHKLRLTNQLTRKEADQTHLNERLRVQKEDLVGIKAQFSTEFKNLANDILEEKSKRFSDQNKQQIHELLKPLGERIVNFEKKVEETNKESIARNSALKEQIAGFKQLNERITQEAENLVNALKGDTKTQGNWGEFILESILENSGLQKDREYFIQTSHTNSAGQRFQPDVIIKLPENKNLIIDAKVSLVAYERFASSSDKAEIAQHEKAHILSIRAHIKNLSDKKYQSLYGIDGLDFVLLFIPIEPAFATAVQKDRELFNDAYAKNIVIVSPTTLIATLRTISSIWNQENYNANAKAIAKEGGNLYDKFVAFTEDVKGAIVSSAAGKATAYALNRLQDRGRFFIDINQEIYIGQVIGENSKDSDLAVNLIKGKQLTNMRKSGTDDAMKIAPKVDFSLEENMEYIKVDEYLEVTPESLRMRKINFKA